MNVHTEYIPREGDVLLTRNPAGHNPTPGNWNHCAIVGRSPIGLCVVEVQAKFRAVAAFRYDGFYRRYPEMIALRPKLLGEIDSLAAAKAAVAAVGTPIQYTITHARTAGNKIGRDNCLSFLRKCFAIGTGTEFDWRTPDDVAETVGFDKVYQKDDADWIEPNDKWRGRLRW